MIGEMRLAWPRKCGQVHAKESVSPGEKQQSAAGDFYWCRTGLETAQAKGANWSSGATGATGATRI